ncbi:MAG: hypothetical protein IKO55_15790, partial [Kiritimatiellae bacterium]|nr:hypothetical protein [Kiritimatiellia bacterium]
VGGRVAASNMGIKGAAEAEAMEKTGADREKIWRETGWWKGKDGKWRFELPRMRREAWHGDPEERHFTGGGDDFYRYRLTELVKNDDFFKAYPQAKKITVEFHKGMPTNVGGNFNEATLTIKLPQKYQVITDYAKYGLGEGKAAGLNAAGAKTIEHELQHAVQLFESFAKGGSPSDPVRPYALDGDTGHALSVFAEANGMDVTNDRHLAIIASNAQKIASDQTRGEMPKRLVEAFEAAAKEAGKTPAEFSDEINRLYDSHTDSPMGQYFKLAGEVEARNAQFRANMTPEERAATPPWETEDVPESRQIVKFAVGRVDGKDMAVIVHEPMRKADMKNEKKVKDYLVENLVGREYRQAGEEKLVKVAPALAKEYWGGSYSSKIRDRFEKLWQAKVGAASVMEDIVGTTPLGGAEAPKSTGKRQSFKKGATFYRCKTTFGALTTDDKVAKYPCELVLLELANGKRFVYDIVNIRNPTLAHDSPKGEALEALKAQTSARSRTTDDIIAQTGAGAQGGERSFNGVTPEQDAAYAEAVKRGDLETARRMEREVY